MAADPELVSILQRLFPSFRGLPPGEADRRAEALGLFAAQAWAAGPDGLRARGIPTPPPVHAGLAPVAPKVVAARNGGATFLVHVRRGFGDDAQFAAFATALAKVYADSLRGGGAPAAPVAAAPPAAAILAAAAPPGAAAPRRPTKEVQAFDALIGSGEFAPLPGAAPAPAPASRPGPAAAGGSSDVARALAAGQLDLLDDDGPRAAPPPPKPKAAPAPKVDLGGLDLLPDDAPPPAPPPKPRAAPAPAPKADLGGLDLADEPEPAPAAAGPAVEEFVMGDDEPSSAADDAAPPGGDGGRQALDMGELEAAQQAQQAASDPALAAIRRFERTGQAAALDEAERHLKQEMAQAPHAPAQAMVAAGLARVELLRGRAPEAERLARAAQTKDPSNPLAVEVLVRLARGEAEAAQVFGGVTLLRTVLDARDPAAITTTAERFRKRWPDEPHAGLALFVAGRVLADEARTEAGLREAWARFPSPRMGHLPWGGGADADLADLLVDHGRAVFKGKDEARLRRTVEGVDDKENTIAGSLRMGVALARVALARPGLSKEQQKRLSFAVGRGLVGLQYFDAALPWFGKASCLGPSADEAKAMSNERVNAGALRRAFDRPGIKAQLKAYECMGVKAMIEALRVRLEAITKDRERRRQEVFAKGAELAAKARTDAALKAEVKRAASAAGVPDPLAPLEAAEAELAAVERERAAAAAGDKKPEAQAGGLFGKLKAAAASAASSVAGAAKEGMLQLKAAQATARRDEACKALGVTLAKQLGDATWQHPLLKAFAVEAALLEAFVDYYDSEESRSKQEMDALAAAAV